MKKLIAMAVTASMMFCMAGCGGSSTSSGSSSSDTSVLSINLASEPDYLDPALNSSVDGGCLAVNSFEGLYTYDSNGNLTPGIADGMPEVSDDETVYTVKMIESKWSNGEDLTANDFVYSWNRVIAEDTAADYAYLFDIIDRNDDGSLKVEATDDYTLKITLTNPCPYFNDLLAFPTFFPVYQKGVEEADSTGKDPGKWAQEAGFVSNGAYTLTSWTHNESMVYTKNENYHNADKVTMNELHFMLSADDTATYAAYNNGDLDFTDSVPTDEIAAALKQDDCHVIDNLGTYYLAFNVNADLFSSMTEQQAKDFRHAITILINRDYIVDNIAQTDQVLADTFVPEGMSDGNGGEFKNKSYFDATTTDVETAKSLLEGCGYTFTDNGNGTYSCDPAISLPYIINENDAHQKIAEAIQSDLSVLGIEMTISTEDWNVFLDDRKNGNFTFAREGWLADYNDPINMLEIFTSDSGNNDAQLGVNPTSSAPQNWDEYDALIKKIRTSTDFSARVDLMHEAEDMLMDTWAVIPIYYYNDIYMQKTNVDGIYATVYGMKYFMYATKS